MVVAKELVVIIPMTRLSVLSRPENSEPRVWFLFNGLSSENFPIARSTSWEVIGA